MSFGVGSEGMGAPETVVEWVETDPIAALGLVVDALLAQDPAALNDEEFAVGVLRERRLMDRLDADLARRALAANRRGIGLEDGYQSTPAWLAWKTGMHRSAVGKVLRHAELTELLPETGQAWRDGAITSTAVELIAAARVAGHDEELAAVEAEFLKTARRGDHKTLRILTQHFAKCAKADGSKPAPPDGLKLVPVGDRHVLAGEFASAAAETIAEALNAFTRPPSANDETTLAVRQAEGFVRMCEVALGRGTDGEGSRPVVSYLTHERRADDASHPLTLGLFTGVIDPRERDRILCDATVVPITTDPDGNPLSVGRATNVWPVHIRRAIIARDHHCRWPGCELPAYWCDAHYFIHWEHGGDTSIDNGLLLCRRHHSFLHAHPQWEVTFDHQHFQVFRPDGTQVHPDPWTNMDLAV